MSSYIEITQLVVRIRYKKSGRLEKPAAPGMFNYLSKTLLECVFPSLV